MIDAKLWNIGLKVTDLDKEIAFWQALGATLLLHETLTTEEGESAYAFLAYGSTRIFLTPTPVFENKLSQSLQPGLTHAVFEVEDVDEVYEKLTALGAENLIKPTEISAAFGSRRISFWRSPNGMVFEMVQVHNSTI